MATGMRPRISVRSVLIILGIICLSGALLIGAGVGIALGETRNQVNFENFTDFRPNLPTKILDRKGRLITEFSADEKREMISINEVPKHLLFALITREDGEFYSHRGFSPKHIMRAVLGKLFGVELGGGSTITQQLAGTLMKIRDQKTITRKLVELWWAMQFERRFTKDEILELYINEMYFGDGYYGIESASKYFFGHSSRQASLAESAVLVLQLSSPIKGTNNPFVHPETAKAKSLNLLKQMARKGYCSLEQAKASWNEYWDSFDYTRVSTAAYYAREDKARYFSDYVRQQLDELLYGSIDYNEDGLTINTTLDLDYQAAADRYMAASIENANASFRADSASRLREADTTIIPIINALTLTFDLEELRSSGTRNKVNAISTYHNQLNPVLDSAALLFGLNGLKQATSSSYQAVREASKKTTVEGALITIENDTGYILSMVGGSGFKQSNQNNRAVQARVSPGSCFKPLYYSAAIDTRKFTPATLIFDEPVVFYKSDGTSYVPLNYKGRWMGPVLLWYALATSMNVPSLKILDGIGFDAAIDRAALLLNIQDPAEKASIFPRVYPLGLGTTTVSPYQMARAFSVFANQGRATEPIAIRSVQDRDGKIILDLEKDLRLEQKRKGEAIQLISPQTAAVMTDLLHRVTLSPGTLSYYMRDGQRFTYLDAQGRKYTIPAAGKTGTTQNWADAWTVGFTPYMTTAIWFGFDEPGNSLGITQTGAAIAGSTWSDYMYDIHEGLPLRTFQKPQTGLIEVEVCAKSGQLPTEQCTDGKIKLLFLEGTQPRELCSLHALNSERTQVQVQGIADKVELMDEGSFLPGTLQRKVTDEIILDESLFGVDEDQAGSLLD
jgi:penicillin-binding protein 1A